MANLSTPNETEVSPSWATPMKKKKKSKKTSLTAGLGPVSFVDGMPDPRDASKWPEPFVMVDKLSSDQSPPKIVQAFPDRLEVVESKYCPDTCTIGPSLLNLFPPPPPPPPPRPSSRTNGISYYFPEPLPPPPPPSFSCSHQGCGVPVGMKPSWPVVSPWMRLSDNETFRSAHAHLHPSTMGHVAPPTTLSEIHQPIIVVENESRSSSRSPAMSSRGRSGRNSSNSSLNSGTSSVSTPQVEKILRHGDLLPCSNDGDFIEEDVLALIEPYNRKVYVSYHNLTSVEFNQYLLFLQYAQADRWYLLPSTETASAIQEIGLRSHCPSELVTQKIAETMAPLKHANPQTCKFPRINTGRALRTRDDLSPDCKCEQRLEPSPIKPIACRSTRCEAKLGGSHYPCAACVSSTRLPRAKSTQLVYLAVVQSFQAGPSYELESGRPIYKVVKTGSRQAAAAQAFFDAGANGWSTVFVCAMPARLDLVAEARGQSCDDKDVVHAKSMDEVLVHEEHRRDWMRVFF